MEPEGKELAVPYGLKPPEPRLRTRKASYASGYAPDGLIAATGAVSVDGSLLDVGSISYKTVAAVAAGVTDVRTAWQLRRSRSVAPDTLNVIGVGSVSEMLNNLGSPRL